MGLKRLFSRLILGTESRALVVDTTAPDDAVVADFSGQMTLSVGRVLLRDPTFASTVDAVRSAREIAGAHWCIAGLATVPESDHARIAFIVACLDALGPEQTLTLVVVESRQTERWLGRLRQANVQIQTGVYRTS